MCLCGSGSKSGCEQVGKPLDLEMVLVSTKLSFALDSINLKISFCEVTMARSLFRDLEAPHIN
jgi:hypothetical protein